MCILPKYAIYKPMKSVISGKPSLVNYIYKVVSPSNDVNVGFITFITP